MMLPDACDESPPSNESASSSLSGRIGGSLEGAPSVTEAHKEAERSATMIETKRRKEVNTHGKHQLLFVQGGGKGVHAKWDSKLVESLRRELEQDYEIHYPRMPNEADASWQKALERELTQLEDGARVVAHSVGGVILLKALTEHRPLRKPAALFFVATPFVGDGGWASDDVQLPADLGAHLPRGVPIHFFQGLQDQITPPSHLDLYARAVPQAHTHRLSGRDHQLNNDLKEVAAAISSLEK